MITFNSPLNRSHLPLLFALLLPLSALSLGFSADLVHQGRIYGYASQTVQDTLTYALFSSCFGVALGLAFFATVFAGGGGHSSRVAQVLNHPFLSFLSFLFWLINFITLRMLFSSGILECDVSGGGLSSCREIQVVELVAALNVLVSLGILVASTLDRSTSRGGERGAYSQV
ncbi:hypothetical protein BDY24DRAFT_412450 [Mrakia frigida]|uniref:uncharacterized protein n=1 Tax=Mrakia frigida TaxID=29902 RepID=UPI003FCC1734